MLHPRGSNVFVQDLSTHLRRMVFGELGLAHLGWPCGDYGRRGRRGGLCDRGAGSAGDSATRFARATIYFSIIWVVLGVAPTLVAGYASSRHMYLASTGWAISLGIAFEVLWSARPARAMTSNQNYRP